MPPVVVKNNDFIFKQSGQFVYIQCAIAGQNIQHKKDKKCYEERKKKERKRKESKKFKEERKTA